MRVDPAVLLKTEVYPLKLERPSRGSLSLGACPSGITLANQDDLDDKPFVTGQVAIGSAGRG